MKTNTGKTGWAFDDRFMDHDLGPGHPECPERLAEIKQLFKQTGLDKELTSIQPVENPDQYIKLVHSDSHIESVSGLQTTGTIARLAAAHSLGAVRDVCSGKLKNAFCCLRPPGHHAHNNGGNYDGPGQGEGFCFFNNIAVAARYAQQEFGLKKILIADWDYHHGNGTEWAFYSDPSVMFFSTHCWMAYPGTGDPERLGKGDGIGFNINIPFNHGAGDEEIIGAFQNQLLPKAQRFEPELILVSAGFDSRVDDLLGTFRVTDKGYVFLTKMLLELADEHCGGKLLSFTEGGYNVAGNASAAAAHVKALLG